jgi:hypothetical protein
MADDKNVRYFILDESVDEDHARAQIERGLRRAHIHRHVHVSPNTHSGVVRVKITNANRAAEISGTLGGIVSQIDTRIEVRSQPPVEHYKKPKSDRNGDGKTNRIDYRHQATELQRQVEELQRQVRDLEPFMSAYDDSLKAEQEFDKRVKDLEAAVSGQDSRAKLFALGEIGSGNVKRFRKISDAYDIALAASNLDLDGDVNEQILNALSRGTVPFDKTLGDDERKNYDQALKLLSSFDSGPFFNASLDIVHEIGLRQSEYENSADAIGNLASALDGTSVRYLMTTEVDEGDYVIGLTMPIENREETTDFSELELDLINHVYEQWSEFRADNAGRFEDRSEVGGLVQYRFRVPTKGRSVEQVGKISSDLAELIFQSQNDYSFGALGMRIDIERIASTEGLLLDVSQAEVTELGNVESGIPVGSTDYAARVTEVYPGFPTDSPVWTARTRSVRGELAQGVLALIAEREQPYRLDEMRAPLTVMFPHHDERIADKATLSQAIALLTDKYELVEAVPGPDGNIPAKNRTYRIKEEYK